MTCAEESCEANRRVAKRAMVRQPLVRPVLRGAAVARSLALLVGFRALEKCK